MLDFAGTVAENKLQLILLPRPLPRALYSEEAIKREPSASKPSKTLINIDRSQ
jgi:hypothetical protein